MRKAFRAGVLSALALLFLGCPTDDPPRGSGITEESGPSEIAFQLPERDLIPEGICYDPVDDVFYVGVFARARS